MTMVVVWVGLCLIPAVVAHNKGRGGLNMFLVSLVLSPLIGLAWAIAMKRQAELNDVAAREGHSKTHWVCPSCAEIVRRDAKVCKHCGRELPAPPALPGINDQMIGWIIFATLIGLLIWAAR